jgi:hypothetical protein
LYEEKTAMKRRTVWAALAASLFVYAGSAQAVIVGQIDNFEDGTVQNWTTNLLGMGTGAPLPQNVASGGPLGLGDNYMQLTSLGGSGAGSRLVGMNLAQWAGNYTAAGVTAIAMDLRNTGNTDLTIRLLFEDPMGGAPTNVAASNTSIFLAAGGGWTHAVIPVLSANLTALEGSATTVLSNTTLLRIYHSPTLTFPGPAVAGQLGVDNITAVPEPATLAAVGCGLLALARRRRRA